MKHVHKYLFFIMVIIMMTSTGFTMPGDDDVPVLPTKSSITALKLGMNYIQHKSNESFIPDILPMPLMDSGYFDYGDWAFYAGEYFHDMVKPNLNSHGDKLFVKPFELKSKKEPVVVKDLGDNKALVRVEYPRHKELERLLQKLYFNLIQGPVILSVAYSAEDIPDDYSQYKNWQCFTTLKDPKAADDGDVHIVFVDWNKVHTVVAFLDGGRIRVADDGRIFDVDHNALVAQGNAIYAIPDSLIVDKMGDRLNYLLYMNYRKVALNK